ncbi:MAG: helix-turn-helix domain-containing protein [Patescibacteria group bacterium]|jgi:sugar-specific transcriptional regulator TrmB
MIEKALESLGLSQKGVQVYLASLKLGPSPVRSIAAEAGTNRGTTYDVLKELIKEGLVSYYHKEKRQYFIAENPEKLGDLLARRRELLAATESELKQIVPELKSLHDNATEKPVTTYFEGVAGIRSVLKDVIETTARSSEKRYAVYSSATIRPVILRVYPNYTADRINAGVSVRVIALGAGGEVKGLDERKWLTTKESAPTYTLIYPGKIAMVTVAIDGTPRAVVINDRNLAETEQLIFAKLFERL